MERKKKRERKKKGGKIEKKENKQGKKENIDKKGVKRKGYRGIWPQASSHITVYKYFEIVS